MQQETKIQGNQTIYDIVLNSLGGFDDLFYFIRTNESVLGNIDADLGQLVGKKLTYDDIYYVKPAPRISIQSAANVSPVYQKRGLENQSIYDLCLQEYGTLDNLVKMMQDSNIVGTKDPNAAFKKITFNKSIVNDDTIVGVVKRKGYNFSTLIHKEVTDTKYLLQEDGDNILLEDGFKILLE